jgi:hypothetical protein
MRRWSALPWIIALPLLLGGCTTNPHRTTGKPCIVAAPANEAAPWERSDGKLCDSWAVRAPSHGVNHVEIDEQGVLHNRAAAEDALAFAEAPPSGGARMAYVVVFIHGWHHNAAPDDANVQAFHHALARVKHWRPQDDVRGIYIGWRGSSLPLPLGYLTFWDRKNTSDEIGRGSLLEFLLRLERSVKPDRASKNRLVLIGHSFGASVAFNALGHLHMLRFVEGLYDTRPGERFRGYGDLTVLINPAIEAMRYMPLQSAVAYYAAREQLPKLDFVHEKKPRLIILSSEGDWATRFTFPVARFFSTALEAHNRISPSESPDPAGDYVEWNMDRDTVGNFTDFQTHWPLRLVASKPAGAGESTGPAARLARLEQCGTPSAAQLQELLRQASADPDEPAPSQAQAQSSTGPKVRGSYFPDSNIRVVRKENRSSIPNSPYIVAGVGVEIIAGHSGVGSENLVCWINQLVDSE